MCGSLCETFVSSWVWSLTTNLYQILAVCYTSNYYWQLLLLALISYYVTWASPSNGSFSLPYVSKFRSVLDSWIPCNFSWKTSSGIIVYADPESTCNRRGFSLICTSTQIGWTIGLELPILNNPIGSAVLCWVFTCCGILNLHESIASVLTLLAWLVPGHEPAFWEQSLSLLALVET